MSQTLPRALFGLALVAAASCGRDESIPHDLKSRLDSVLDVARKEPTPDEVRDVLVRQLRAASLPSRDTISAFYAKHGNLLVWSDTRGTAHAGTAVLLDALRR